MGWIKNMMEKSKHEELCREQQRKYQQRYEEITNSAVLKRIIDTLFSNSEIPRFIEIYSDKIEYGDVEYSVRGNAIRYVNRKTVYFEDWGYKRLHYGNGNYQIHEVEIVAKIIHKWINDNLHMNYSYSTPEGGDTAKHTLYLLPKAKSSLLDWS